MSFIGTFIGIDKHADQNIKELTGARRDALALWALFSDAIPDINADLLVNENATCEKIKKTLEDKLGSAGADDIVIFSFAGHGTQDHRLVTYNTVKESIADTTISMQNIAELFKISKAKIILFILDCCFSGAAPARVLEDTPILRDTDDLLSAIAGQGRIIIAASGKNEPALEHPRFGHGLLTKAIIDIFKTEETSVSIPAAMDRVSQIVRSEAGKMGYSQNPVCLSYVESGLILPALKPGKKYFECFPETMQENINNSFVELSKFDFPAKVINAWSNQFSGGLNNLQLEAINKHRIFNGNSLLVIAPTSTGKTFIGELASVHAIIKGKKAIFLLPYRALVNEKYEYFSQIYGSNLQMRIIRCSGDYADQVRPFLKGKYELAIFTFEMFLNVAITHPHVLHQIGLIVLDEAQFITDPHRGISVELILTYLLSSKKKDITPQIIALSAVIGGINDFDKWLELSVLATNQRPVPLTEGVIDRNGTFEFQNHLGKRSSTQLLNPYDIIVRRDKPSNQDIIVPLVKKLLKDNPNEKIIVFRNMRGKCEGCAKYLSSELGLPAASDIQAILPNHDLSSASESLRVSLSGGTAFHNTDLISQERNIIEQAFRDPNSKVRVLVSTTTLAAGINTPASTVILAEQEFFGEDRRAFTVAEYKNMAGRAGRLGFREEGKAIIVANNDYERNYLFKRYITGPLEVLNSSFDQKHVETWFVRLLAQMDHVAKTDVVNLLLNTFGGYLSNRNNPEWQSNMSINLSNLLEKMINLGLVEEELAYIRLTLLGRICGQSSLSFNSTLRAVEILRNFPEKKLNAITLMAITQGLTELDDCYISIMKRGTKESIRVSEATSRYGSEAINILQQHVNDFFQYYARCKKAAILYDWINGESVNDIEKRYSTTPYAGAVSHGDIRRCVDTTRFHLRSIHQIVMVMNKPISSEAIERLLNQLEFGIPEDSLELLSLPIDLTRGEYLALRSTNIKKPQELNDGTFDLVQDILGEQKANLLKNDLRA
ncbi:MAG: DEAD/DEAH box helicase [bacterium]